MIKLNETSAFLFRTLAGGADEEALVAALLAEYDVEEALARRDVAAFLDTLRKARVLDE